MFATRSLNVIKSSGGSLGKRLTSSFSKSSQEYSSTDAEFFSGFGWVIDPQRVEILRSQHVESLNSQPQVTASSANFTKQYMKHYVWKRYQGEACGYSCEGKSSWFSDLLYEKKM